MNKFTKLLSVFVIAGAVSTGVAALAGCGGEQPHVHSATKHEAVAATCTQEGTQEYYTCDGADCEGKYFSDEACTTEVTLESLTIAATGHTEVYTDNGDGTHGITCEKGDLTEITEAHADEDHDGKCDACEATVAGTFIEEVAATCTSEGTKAHYINGDGSDGKYYSDVNCKNEVTAESLVIAKIPHAYTYTPDTTQAKHTYICGECGDTDTVDCVDEDNDGKCDDCGGDVTFLTQTAIPAGSYYNSDYDYELIVAEDGTVSYNYYGTAMTNVSVTEFAVDAETGLPTATLSYTQYGYDYTKTAEIVRGGITLDGTFLPLMSTPIVEYKDAFEGVFSGELVMPADSEGNVVKVTEFAITADGNVVYTQVITDKDGNSTSLTQLINGSYYDVKYNDFKISSRHFVAVEVDDDGMVTKIDLTDNNVTATFTYKDGYNGEGFEIPTLLVEDYTLYKDTAGTNTLAISDYSTSPNYAVSFNEHDVTILSGSLTEGYVGYVYYYDSAASKTVEKNIILKFNADSSAVEVFEIDGTTSIATLALSEVEYPTLVADGTTVNNNAVVDPFNTSYAYYEVGTTGWYKITAGDNDVTIYTEVADHYVTTWGASVYDIGSGKSKAIQLTAGQYIAVSAYYKEYGFTATYSETEPEPDYILVADGKAEIIDFTGADVYFVKGTTGAAGKYYVTVSNTQYEDKGPYFIVNDTKYGYTYDNSSWSYSELATGHVYSAELTAGETVIIKVGCDNSYLNLTKVVVTFETEEEYNARLAAEATPPTFSGDQLGNYQNGSNKYVVTADGIALNGTALTFVKNKTDVIYYTDGTYSYAISFTEDGDLSITSNGDTYTAIKPVDVTFTEEQQGTYAYSYERRGSTYTITYTVGANSLTVTSGYGDEELVCISYINGVYTYQNSSSDTMTFSFDNDGNMSVVDDYITYTGTYVAVKQASSGGEETSGLIVGTNTITEFTDYMATVTFTATEAGTYTFDFSGLYSTSTSCSINNETLTPNMQDGSATATLTLAANQTITIVVEDAGNGLVTIEISKATTDVGGVDEGLDA